MSDNKRGYHVEIEQVNKSFGETAVLKNINLTIDNGEFVAIVGRSGCGKSTLLRMVSSLETPTSGTIRLDGVPVSGINLDVRFLFQDARLLPWKTVWKNISIAARNKSRERAVEALREVKLEDHADEWPSILSGGQKQRVALARALVGEPKILLLDEPLGALDALTRIEMQILIEKLWREQGFTVILVTHDVSEAVTLADRVVLIDEGEITMDKKITLARPRIRDNSFMYFEKYILDRVMKNEEVEEVNSENGTYLI